MLEVAFCCLPTRVEAKKSLGGKLLVRFHRMTMMTMLMMVMMMLVMIMVKTFSQISQNDDDDDDDDDDDGGVYDGHDHVGYHHGEHF